MSARATITPRRLRPHLSLRRPIVALSVGVLLPVVLSTSVGIVILAIGEGTTAVVTGVLVVSFTAAAIGGAVVATVLLKRRAAQARLQTDLMANVSHELRTPLAAIRMYAQTLQQPEVAADPERRDTCLATIVRETEWLEASIARLLAWRAAARDRDTLDLHDVSLNPAVEAAIERFERMVPADEITLERDLCSATPVRHDAHAMTDVMLNLLINAYKYTRKDKHLRVTTRDEGDEVLLEVEDNGMGIPREEHERIFEPFHRVDARLAARPSGVGLGLAIVRSLVTAHEGRIQVASDAGRGAMFSIRLPVAKEDRP